MRTLRLIAGAIALAAGLTACGEGSAPSREAQASTPTVTVTSIPAPTPGLWIRAVVHHRTPALVQPSKGATVVRWLEPRTAQGSQTVLLVLGSKDEYLQVALPGRPNGARAWVRRGQVQLEQGSGWILVQTQKHKIRFTLPDGRAVTAVDVIVGKASTPTPRTPQVLSFVTDRVIPGPELGTFALGLAIRSNVLTAFGGGEGDVAIHGWPHSRQHVFAAGNLNRSHGCIRVREKYEGLLRRFLMGTPVDIE